jgi:hypothetical protein
MARPGGDDTAPCSFAQVHDHRVPPQDTTKRDPRFDPYRTGHECDAGIKSAVEAGARAGESVAQGKIPGLNDETYNAEETRKAERAGQVKTSSEDTPPAPEKKHIADETLSWGRSGAVETSVGWGDKPQPNAATSFQTGSPDLRATPPSDLGKPLRPDTNHNQSMNAEQIFSMTNFGGYPR